MKRRISILAMLLAFAMVVAACSSASDDTTTTAGDTGGETTTTAAPDTTTTTAGTPDTTEAPAEIKTDIGVDGKTIKIGLLADLTGPFGVLVQDIVDAQQTYWDGANAEGALPDGYTVELVVRDTTYQIPTHQQLYAELKEEVAAFSESTGSPHTSSIVPDLKADNMFVIPLSWYSGWADPDFGSNVLEQGTNYCLEAMNLMEFAANQNMAINGNDKPTVAIVTRAGEYGQDGAAGFKIGAEALGLEVVYDGEGKIIKDADLSALIVAEVAPTNPDWIFVTGSSSELGAMMGAAAAAGLTAQWTGSAPSYNQRLLDSAIGEYVANFYWPSWYFVPWASDVPENVKMKEALAAKFPDRLPTDWFVRGWVEGLMINQILEAAIANGDLTQKGILDAALSLESIDFKGLQPAQGYAGTPNEYLLRESIVFGIDFPAYTASTGTLSDPSANTGSVIAQDFFASQAAQDFDFVEPCFTG